MERERYSDDDLIERQIEDETESPEPEEETEIERRSGPDVMREVEPCAPRERAEAVYGETDIDPNAEDQRSAHHAESDEHL
jgi:ketosteroid isomerase-like protein